tara:strand:+ start:2930 stop:3481 length:552 start_codon:yes stop_codon:yes gene_type:complete
MKPTFDIVVAHDANLGIGIDNKLAWHLPEDMSFFKQLTMGDDLEKKYNIVIMGRKTYESIPDAFRPLSNRLNIILTQLGYDEDHEDVRVASSIDEALLQAGKLVQLGEANNIYCIGGKSIYEKMISYEGCRYLYVTYLDYVYNCDAFFPSYEDMFTLVERSDIKKSKTGMSYQFKLFQSNTLT